MRFQRWTGRREEASAALERVGERLWQWRYQTASSSSFVSGFLGFIRAATLLEASCKIAWLAARGGGEHD